MLRLAPFALALGFWVACSPVEPDSETAHESTEAPIFWRGNTHTHTLWSDGNGAPELVVDWYLHHDYDFLVLSDHNILSTGEKWFPVSEDKRSRLTADRVADLQGQFGASSVLLRETEQGQQEMRLHTLPELRSQFERPGKFLFLQGEEITDQFQRANIHINAINLDQLIAPQHGDSISDTLQRNFDAIEEQAQRQGSPILAHLNHPNFTWSMTWQDFAGIKGERFFEVYNGHSGVRNYGDAAHPATETMWDLVNTARLREFDLPLLYGVATDDSHEYFQWGAGKTNPGRGWVMVQSPILQADRLVQAMDDGEFYASSGVSLISFAHDASGLSLSIGGQEGASYTTEFVGTRGSESGVVLASSQSLTPSYTFAGDELFVRARVRSSLAHPNPYAAGDPQMAWLQPVRGPGQ
jgi:histidinol phosphatase-like PHP family hydrolase